MVPLLASFWASTPDCPESDVVHRTELTVLLLDVCGGQIDVLPSHFERCMPEYPLQAEGIPAIDQVPHAKSVAAGMWVEFWNARQFPYPLKHFPNRIMGDGESVHSQINAVLILRIYRIASLLGKIIGQRFLCLEAHGNLALLVALSEDRHFANGKIDIGQLQIDEFAKPDAGIQ